MLTHQDDLTQHPQPGRGRTRSKLPVVLAVTAALALVVSSVSPVTAGAQPALPAPPPPARPPAVTTTAAAAPDWHSCRDGFDCATFRVPLDHDRPGGEQIGLSLIRLPAASPRTKIGSLFVNPGGPGGSGVDIVRGIAQYLPLELRSRFDIVGFDPRGVGRSTPLRCYDTFEQALRNLPPFSFPYTDQQEPQNQAAGQKLAAACAEHGGPILHHRSTADVARDMDRLRAAVGDRRLTYLGFSYGSVLGQTYANLFPGRVRALVIDGVVDPVSWTTGRGTRGTRIPVTTRLRGDRGARATLRQFFRLCDQARRDCAFSSSSSSSSRGAAERYGALAAQLRRAPIVF